MDINRDLFADEAPAKVASSWQETQKADLDIRVASTQSAITAAMALAQVIKVGFSGGKDSASMLNLVLNAAKALVQRGAVCPRILVMHGDTTIESPVVRYIADSELSKASEYAARHKLPLSVHIARPALSSGFAAKIIGGRALPSFPSKARECSIDWKIIPSKKLAKALQKRLGNTDSKSGLMLTMLGTRESESPTRNRNTRARRESQAEIWFNSDGTAMLSPILDWSSDDVFEYLGYCAAGIFDSYSDFGQVMEFYSDAGGSSCSVIGDITVARNAKPCGARGGCFLCVAATDKSARTMIESEPEKYPYLVPLLRLRDFISATEFDWSRRSYIARTIDAEGYIRIAADQYSPAMCEELLRYSLAAQSRANALGSPSRVSIVGIRELIAIDFFWSIRGLHPPFHAVKIYLEHLNGVHTEAPVLPKAFRRSPAPEVGKLFVGTDWDGDDCAWLGAAGLRDPLWEMHGDTCGPGLRASKGGKLLLSLEEADTFDVDVEGALMFLDFEAERMIETWHREGTDWTAAASIYLRYGCVSLGKGMSISVDRAIRRSQWRQRHNLHGQRGQDELWKRCTSRVARQEKLFSLRLEDIPLVAI